MPSRRDRARRRGGPHHSTFCRLGAAELVGSPSLASGAAARWRGGRPGAHARRSGTGGARGPRGSTSRFLMIYEPSLNDGESAAILSDFATSTARPGPSCRTRSGPRSIITSPRPISRRPPPLGASSETRPASRAHAKFSATRPASTASTATTADLHSPLDLSPREAGRYSAALSAPSFWCVNGASRGGSPGGLDFFRGRMPEYSGRARHGSAKVKQQMASQSPLRQASPLSC